MKNVHTVTITLEGKDWTSILDNTFKKKNSEVTISGFRKGKAPKDVYMKKFGIESLYMDSIDEALRVAYERALTENELVPACEPKADVKTIDEKHVELEFTIITKPEVKISSYKKLGVKKDEAKVSKEEIEAEIKNLQSRFAEIIVKEDGVVQDGDIAVIDFEGFVDGEAFEGGKGSEYPLEIGSNTFIPGFESQLIGVKTGESKDVNVKFPEDYVENLKGKDAVFKVTVKEVRARVLPEMNEEFFKDLGYDDVKTESELKDKIKEHLMEHKKEEVENKYIDELIKAGIDKMTVEINEEIIDEEVHRMMHDLEQRMSMQGITLDQYFAFTGTTHEDFHKQAEPEAINRIKSRYLLDEIIEKEKLEATEDEVMEHAKEQASKYQCDVNEIIEMYGGMEVVKYDLLIHKAIKVLEG